MIMQTVVLYMLNTLMFAFTEIKEIPVPLLIEQIFQIFIVQPEEYLSYQQPKVLVSSLMNLQLPKSIIKMHINIDK